MPLMPGISRSEKTTSNANACASSTASAAWPLLLTVTVDTAEGEPVSSVPKLTLAADKAMVACGVALPVPLSATLLLPPVALCVMLSEAARAPAAVGLKLACTVQLAPAATAPPLAQLPPATLKSPAAAPLIPQPHEPEGGLTHLRDLVFARSHEIAAAEATANMADATAERARADIHFVAADQVAALADKVYAFPAPVIARATAELRRASQ